jgi:hypothetical protein
MTDEPVAVKRGLLTAGGRPGNWLSGLGIPDERLPDHHALGGTVSCPAFSGQGICGYFTRLPARSGTRP